MIDFGTTRKLPAGYSFASCCGAAVRYSTPMNPSNSKGITVYMSQVGKEYETTHHLLKHVQTKNGVVSVLIRKAE